MDVKQVGRELGVRYLLEGSVRKSANRIRIVGQLIDAASSAHLWADRFEGPGNRNTLQGMQMLCERRAYLNDGWLGARRCAPVWRGGPSFDQKRRAPCGCTLCRHQPLVVVRELERALRSQTAQARGFWSCTILTSAIRFSDCAHAALGMSNKVIV